jgi:EpsG family
VLQKKQIIVNTGIATACFLIFIAIAYSLFGQSKDFINYDNFFDRVRFDDFSNVGGSRIEYGFALLTITLTSFFSSNVIIVSLIAAVSLAIKLKVVSKVAATYTSLAIGILFYCVRFAPLHEMTQVRASVAIALLFISFYYMLQGKRSMSIIYGCLSPLFHTSALIVFMLITLNQTTYLDYRRLTIQRVLLYSAFSLFVTKFLVDLIIQEFGEANLTLAMYISNGFGEARPNPFSISILLDLYTILFGFILWQRLSKSMQVSIFYLTMGLILFYMTIGFPVVAHRIRELLSVFTTFLVTFGMGCGLVVRLYSFSIFIFSILIYMYIYFIGGNFFIL